MIRGKFLTSNDDTGTILDIRKRVFCDEQGFDAALERDKYDDMAIYALVFDENDTPSGTGRLYLDDAGRFTIGRICTLSQARGQGLGDLIMRMLLYRAQELSAPSVHLSAQMQVVPFYARYGFRPYGEPIDDEGVPHRLMRATADEIDIEGSCSKSACAQCGDADCENCAKGAEI